MSFLPSLLATLVFLLSTSTTAGAEKTSAEDWLRHPHDHKYYTEAWTAVLEGEDGHIAFVNILYSNIGVVSGSAAVRVSVARPGESSKHFVHEYSTDEYGEDPKTGRIGVSSSWMALQGRTLTIHIKEADVKMDLVVKSWTDGVKWGDGTVLSAASGDRFAKAFFHVIRGDVEGDLTLGEEEVKFKGAAYVDHWVQNVLGTDYSSRWWIGRAFGSEYSLFFMTVRTREGFGDGMFHRLVLCKRGEVLVSADKYKLKADKKRTDPAGHEYDTRYKVQFGRGKRHGTAVFSGKKLFDREAILDQMNAAQRQIVRLIAGNPVTYRLRGKATVKVMLDGTETEFKSSALLESVVLED